MSQLRRAVRRIVKGPKTGQQWVRVEMDRAVDAFLTGLDPPTCEAVEVSGKGHGQRAWKSYRAALYPEFDLLHPSPLGQFDVVLCEQVLEHVVDPGRAVRHLADLCKPGGHVVITTPFMLRIHRHPLDLWRFTPDGMVQLVEEAGLEVVQSGSWGNVLCILANRADWAVYRPVYGLFERFTMANDPGSPQVVWTFARKPPVTSPTP